MSIQASEVADTPLIFDLIFSYNNLKIENISHGIPLGESDHALLEAEYVFGDEITVESE